MSAAKPSTAKTAKKLNPAGAEKLKAQGNALFAQRKWAGAHAKYSEAIEQDDTNPVYWANRAACNLETKDYLEACTDAGTAIDLDPTYAKAWGRLGAAQRAVANYEGSISAYKKALEVLPSADNMTPADKKLEEQFSNALELVLEEQKNSPRKSNAVMIGAEKPSDLDDALPWNRAENMAEELHEAGNRDSSVWLILGAYEKFKEGVAIMNLLTSATTGNQRATTGGKNAIAHIVGGLIRDQRVFHAERTFFERFPLQVRLELSSKKAWDCSNAVIKKEAKERLETQSWNVVCESLYTTIWVWILRAFLMNSSGAHPMGMELYGKALELIEWGRETWRDAPEDPDADLYMFDPVVGRGVRTLYLNSIMDALSKGTTEKYTFQDLIKMAQTLVDDVEANPPASLDDVEPQDYLAFWVNPKAEALSMIGFCYMRMAHKAREPSARKREFSKAAEYYTKSAESFPEDDEKRVYFLTLALEALWGREAPVKETLPVVEKAKKSIPKMKKIWEHSAMSKRRDASITLMLQFEKQVRKALKSGRMTMDGVAKPQMP
ncbi:hypothetical protein CCMSSC00406_0002645 [Pleurotus cornucopiae]|uniref:Uncharacterized protein n=1 Tax=Pleurotus cornucopiae TaxID=5321 RepID=A0ACB7IWE2_PLECO|nr:hypothetical protein CCMSSC00406_0002645 [Pleurotus cornucopiae]